MLVFTDHNRGNPALEPSTLPFHHEGTAEDYDAIRTLALDQQMRTRKVTLGDWDFERAAAAREHPDRAVDRRGPRPRALPLPGRLRPIRKSASTVRAC